MGRIHYPIYEMENNPAMFEITSISLMVINGYYSGYYQLMKQLMIINGY